MTGPPPPAPARSAALLKRAARVLAGLLLPWLAAWGLQLLQAGEPAALGVHQLRSARVLAADDTHPPAALASAPRHTLPLRLPADAGHGVWLALDLPPPQGQLERLSLAFRPGVEVWLDDHLLGHSYEGLSGRSERLILGHEQWMLDLPAALREQHGAVLQLHLPPPGPSGTSLQPVLLGPPAAVQRLDEGRQHWQLLRAATALGGVMVAAFLLMVARVRRDDPLYLLSGLHVALLALLLSPYVLPDQPLPSPVWRMLLDAADLAAKALLVGITARLAGGWQPGLRRALLALMALALPIDLLAAAQGWAWSNFSHLWPWWALAVRGLLLAAAWGYALRGLARSGGAGDWATALLVGFSAATWAVVSLGALVLDLPVVDANALAHAGWVAWVALLLQRHFIDGARRELALRQALSADLTQRTGELQQAFDAQARAERERAASDQRRRLLQDLHDGLGARLLGVRLQLSELDGPALAQALDDCLLEMRLSVDTLADDDGDLGVLLGSWRQRVAALARAADLALVWRVAPVPPLPCLQEAGALELVRGLQELLSNCIRHADARHLTVATELHEHEVALWLVDDGRGLPPQASPGQGRRGLLERARRLGGSIEWHSPAPPAWDTAGPGTAVVWRLPLRAPGRDDAPRSPPEAWSAPAASDSSA
ncbi:MAG: hypothetical protein DI603_11195 [Roseateles depolymerans]|uniref:Signal transduction histidine kinase n=1 Tax=Roseateles depolymerans TaxID=76731 RepID=A0A2W5FGM5_9BURK|nr:MAG: hypothetical protein DI603_11195 [Roseateles depolymerans]